MFGRGRPLQRATHSQSFMPAPPHPSQVQLGQTPADYPSPREGGTQTETNTGLNPVNGPALKPSICHLLSGSVPTTCQRFPNPPRPALLSCRTASVAAHQVPLSRQPHIPTRHPHMSPVLPHSLALVLHPQPMAPEALTRVKFTASAPSSWNTPHSWPSVNSAAVPHRHAPGLPATLLGSLLPQ